MKVCKINTHDNPANMMMKHVPVTLLKLSWCYSLVPSEFRHWQVDMLIDVKFIFVMLQRICLKVEFVDI
jgi:hypothetical protein